MTPDGKSNPLDETKLPDARGDPLSVTFETVMFDPDRIEARSCPVCHPVTFI